MRPLHQAHNKDFFLRHLAIKVLPIALLMTASAGFSQSSLLETVKRNPGEAKALCQQFKSLNSREIGLVLSSHQATCISTQPEHQRRRNSCDLRDRIALFGCSLTRHC